MDYIRSTQNVPSAPEKVIVDKGYRSWRIGKYHCKKNYITGETSDAKWHKQAVNELCILLNQTLVKKAKKLALISYPKILLIRDRYPWLERNDWKECLPNLDSIDEFHTIFIVSNNRSNWILNSTKRSWLRM